MGVVGAFGLRRTTRQSGCPDFLPLVYVAQANTEDEVRTIHRRVWSQGVVPFLLVVTPNEIWLCDATTYASTGWTGSTWKATWPSELPSPGPIDNPAFLPFRHLRAGSIRASVQFAQSDLGSAGTRVDAHLLGGLRALGAALTGANDVCALPRRTANKLIASLLYFYCLLDRGIITPEWLAGRGHQGILTKDAWELQSLWDLLDDLDRVFNGRVFHLPITHRKRITKEQADLVRRVIKGGELLLDGVSQPNLFEVDLSVVRTETLSAVYEMFFESEGDGVKDEDGAFYTPPFLVDYVLSKVDDIKPVEPGLKVVDCSAGSGLFLVGAYRRMLETVLDEDDREHLPLERLRQILVDSIYGIERNEDAVQIAAFSLFLTMLEYGGDALVAEMALAGRDPNAQTIFPPLIGTSLLARDLFDTAPRPAGFPNSFDVLLGNPPWQKVGVIGKTAETWAEEHELHRKMDRDRAAELFFWTGYDTLLKEGGVFGMVLSAKSFLSPGANRFPKQFIKQVGVTGLVNLTHLRRKLFPGAEHPAIAVVGRRATPSADDAIWVHYPLLSALPLDRSGRPWCIVQDLMDIEVHPRRQMSDPEGLFRALMLRPVDRRVATYLDDRCRSGEILTLAALARELDFSIRRGGPPKQTGLQDDLHLGTQGEKHYVRRLGLPEKPRPGRLETELTKKRASVQPKSYSLTPEDLARANAPYDSLFRGDIVVVPRNLNRADFVPTPFAFNSSLIGIYFQREPNTALAPDRLRLLKALARYLNSNFVRYAAALYGRMWMVDRRRFEAADLERLPIPFTSLEDPRITEVLTASDAELEEILPEFMLLSPELGSVAREYVTTRLNFENGILPLTALRTPTTVEIDGYRETLSLELERALTSGWHVGVELASGAEGAGTVNVTFSRHLPQLHAVDNARSRDVQARSEALEGTSLVYDAAAQFAAVTKPLVAARWSREQAVTDSRHLLERVFSGPDA
nr:N-6 DNA methylase [Enterovirga sp. DB1703]